MMRSLIKRILPRPVKGFIDSYLTQRRNERQGRHTRVVTERVQHQYESLSVADTFARIYASGGWGGNGDVHLSSGRGSTGRYVQEYCSILEHALREHNINSVADLGCGNFNTGKAIARMVTDYIGVDIVESVVNANARAYAMENIRFVRADMTKDPLPAAEAVIVRQVLQHLNNSEIQSALSNILRTYRLAFVTEHIYIGKNSKPNLDFGHGPGTRVPMKSGVFIDQPPFSLRATRLGDIPYAPNEVLRTWSVLGNAGR